MTTNHPAAGEAMTLGQPRPQAPERIQLRRTKGWRKPAGAVVVARPSRWGNPYRVGTIAELWRNPRYTTSTELVVWHAERSGGRTGAQWAGFADRTEATRFAIDLFRRSILATAAGPDGALILDDYLGPLRGRDLACWCPLGRPCHADALIDLATRGTP